MISVGTVQEFNDLFKVAVEFVFLVQILEAGDEVMLHGI